MLLVQLPPLLLLLLLVLQPRRCACMHLFVGFGVSVLHGAGDWQWVPRAAPCMLSEEKSVYVFLS